MHTIHEDEKACEENKNEGEVEHKQLESSSFHEAIFEESKDHSKKQQLKDDIP